MTSPRSRGRSIYAVGGLAPGVRAAVRRRFPGLPPTAGIADQKLRASGDLDLVVGGGVEWRRLVADVRFQRELAPIIPMQTVGAIAVSGTHYLRAVTVLVGCRF